MSRPHRSARMRQHLRDFLARNPGYNGIWQCCFIAGHIGFFARERQLRRSMRPLMPWKPPQRTIQQHTRVWRDLGSLQLLGRRYPKGRHEPLATVLRKRFYQRAESDGRYVPTTPPGLYRTPWCWFRAAQFLDEKDRAAVLKNYRRQFYRRGGL